MKNFLAALICGTVILSATIGFAAVDGGKIALSGIMPGMSEIDLIGTCGQPIYKDGDDWTYKNFKVEVERGVVTEISTRNEALMTPDGLRVGQAAEALNVPFGKADKVDRDRDDTEYKYYSTDRTKKIEFKVVNGVIVKISCKLVD